MEEDNAFCMACAVYWLLKCSTYYKKCHSLNARNMYMEVCNSVTLITGSFVIGSIHLHSHTLEEVSALLKDTVA